MPPRGSPRRCLGSGKILHKNNMKKELNIDSIFSFAAARKEKMSRHEALGRICSILAKAHERKLKSEALGRFQRFSARSLELKALEQKAIEFSRMKTLQKSFGIMLIEHERLQGLSHRAMEIRRMFAGKKMMGKWRRALEERQEEEAGTRPRTKLEVKKPFILSFSFHSSQPCSFLIADPCG